MTRTSLLRRPTALRRLGALGLLTAAGLALSTSQALADGETITLAQTDPTAVVDHAVNFTASGALNPNDTMFGFDIYVFLKDADVDPTCAADFSTESANAVASGGYETWISPSTGFQVGMGPSFNQSFKITFTTAGHYLLCGYVNGDFSTFAAGQLRITASAAATTTPTTTTTSPSKTVPTTGSLPNVVRAPWVTLSRHLLTCHAGTWSNKPSKYTDGWYVKGRSKKLASGSTLKVKASLRGRQVMCKVTAKNAIGTSTVTSKAIRAR